MMTKEKAIVVVGKDVAQLTEWARSSACTNDHIESMSDPNIGLYKYVDCRPRIGLRFESKFS